MTKECAKCGAVKDLDQFNVQPDGKHGRHPYCKPCVLAYNREWAERNRQRRREQCRVQHGTYLARNGKRRASKLVSKEARRAHLAVARALKSGVLEKPARCPSCGSQDSPIHAHHADYSQPLDVRWLCAPCHGRLHATEGTPA
jgi:ribosomal protein S27AE